jgi:three-Cys-motif partner protein
VGGWATQKIHFLTQYLGIFAAGMKSKWGGNIHYIELCSGPGRCLVRETAREMDGSALAVLGHQAAQYLKTATFIDYNPKVVQALNDRISRMETTPDAVAIEADYNDTRTLADIVRRRASTGLSLVFIDPTDCSLPFDAVKAIAFAAQNADFIINVATGTDASRNLKQAILNPNIPVRAKYAKFLGNDSFFTQPQNVQMAQMAKDRDLRIAFRTAYCDSFQALGYRHFAFEAVKSNSHTFYDLMFASRHPLGLKFWKEAQRIGPDEQRTFDLGV